MTTIYGMLSCPDTTYVLGQVIDNAKFKFVDIGRDVEWLKAFLRLRDHDAVFAEVKAHGGVGIPCFVLEDGTVTLNPCDVGLEPRPVCGVQACSI